LADVFTQCGHTVEFIRTHDTGSVWWDDCKELAKVWPSTAIGAATYDYIIEMDNLLLSEEARKKYNAKHIWFFREPPILHDIEGSLYPISLPKRNLKGISTIWIYEELSSSDDIQYLELLTRIPVQRLPFLWSPLAVEVYKKEIGSPEWHTSSPTFWSIHICETNRNSASNSTIPLLIVREIRKKSATDLNPIIKIHNAETIKDSEFFQKNVLAHVFSDSAPLTPQMVGRQRIVDFSTEANSILIAHLRFIPIRPYILDALWCGIPIIHNSPLLKDIYPAGYYSNNSIHEGRLAFERVTKNAGELNVVRRKVLEKFSPMSSSVKEAWSGALAAVGTGAGAGAGASVEASPAAPAAPATSVAPAAPAAPAAPVTPLAPVTSESKDKPTVRIGFCDMWSEFNASYNMFTLMLENLGRVSVIGTEVVRGDEPIDILLFGPFGNSWEQVNSRIPKIHYTGENSPPVVRDDVKLNLGFMRIDHPLYIRLPLWMLEIDWFNADVERIRNPKPIPLERCCRTYSDELSRKTKFCAFVVTNPCQPMRNEAFHWMNSYKPVDSAGRLFNTMGNAIFAGLGGGGGELKKLEFLKDYKFCLSYENNSSPGYTTEKLLHAKAAGCIPIYWGDPEVAKDFNMEGVINANDFTSKKELIEAVKKVDESDSEYMRKFSVPLLDMPRLEAACSTMQLVVSAMLRLAGASASAPAPLTSAEQPTSSSNTLFLTCVNVRFLPSLVSFVAGISEHIKKFPSMSCRVYFMNDVPESAVEEFRSTYSFITALRLPSDPIQGFPDCWAPEHFFWKLWILRECVRDPSVAGRPVLYMDAGTVLCRYPYAWMNAAIHSGMAVLEDVGQDNEHWCHSEFRKALAVTAEELRTQQIWAGSLAFIAGHPLVSRVFEESYTWGQQRAVIQGPKWSGLAADSKPHGHRHDQSILSIVTQRLGVPRLPLYDFYCHISLRHTYLKGASIYTHRGTHMVHRPVTNGIDDIFVINLDRRKDRLEKFYATHPGLAERVLRMPAFDGKALKLTPALTRLFAPNDFKWKKSVMGCALSHLALWNQLVTDKPDINSYLVLEDDVVLSPTWMKAWNDSFQMLPADWDVVYLGGILPPNREAFDTTAVEKVNERIGRIKMNTFFGQRVPNRYFHFCAYSYVISKRGANKVLEVMKSRGGYWTSADHMMCNIPNILNMYFLTPLVAGCYQDSDPVYKNSLFNDYSRIDTFDSDLWNNVEEFTAEEVAAAGGGGGASGPLSISDSLMDARRVCAAAVAASVAPAAVAASVVAASVVAASVVAAERRIVSTFPLIMNVELYEYTWLKELFGKDSLSCVQLKPDEMPTDSPIIVFQTPHQAATLEVITRWASAGLGFYVLHISDEHGKDPVYFYDWPQCLGVVRNYVRSDVKENVKVVVIPLGYHWSGPEAARDALGPAARKLVWSFAGTEWHNRKDNLKLLEEVEPNILSLQNSWRSSTMLSKDDTLELLTMSKFVPCPRGGNNETFRFYEALEAGAVPILVKEEGCTLYYSFLTKWLPILVVGEWKDVPKFMREFMKNSDAYAKYSEQLLKAWKKMKEDAGASVRRVFQLA